MGETPEHIWVTGAPGLDGLRELASIPREALLAGVGIAPGERVALLVFHPVLQEAASAGAQAQAVLDSLQVQGLRVVALLPNADAGSDAIRQVLIERQQAGQLHLATHFPRREFVSWMAAADLMVGNSSAGIIEAASFGTPVVNIGLRQNLRERNANVIDCAAEPAAITQALVRALQHGRFPIENVYGDGATAPRILQRLAMQPLDAQLLLKTNAY
jgi:GDP/UDP-N,N'-diacetylbacillosamine 2-epimerase (hydrolysing)